MNTFAINTTVSIRENTLQRLRLLETLYENGYQDEVVDRLSKSYSHIKSKKIRLNWLNCKRS